ncbi:hypothetical protein B5B97_04600 [Staphylococcus delphini]|nr:hypothetical protein B5B97_04600 [Staphylococcus delphini]
MFQKQDFRQNSRDFNKIWKSILLIARFCSNPKRFRHNLLAAPRKAKPRWQSKAELVGRGQVQQKYCINSIKNFNVPSPTFFGLIFIIGDKTVEKWR